MKTIIHNLHIFVERFVLKAREALAEDFSAYDFEYFDKESRAVYENMKRVSIAAAKGLATEAAVDEAIDDYIVSNRYAVELLFYRRLARARSETMYPDCLIPQPEVEYLNSVLARWFGEELKPRDTIHRELPMTESIRNLKVKENFERAGKKRPRRKLVKSTAKETEEEIFARTGYRIKR